MALHSSILKAMAGAGCTIDQIIAAVEASERPSKAPPWEAEPSEWVPCSDNAGAPLDPATRLWVRYPDGFVLPMLAGNVRGPIDAYKVRS